MSDVKDYTIGCICALPTPEGVALRLFLDEEHDPPRIPAAHVSSTNRPIYVTGTMGSHKVAIATLPEGSYGIASATSVIDDMVRSFPNIRCCLMVGIGGGAPNLPDHDIRLGDVVVSSPRNGLGGILQYDHGKAIQGQPFYSTQHLNEPPRYLMSAVGELVQRYEMDDMPLQRMVSEALARKPKLRPKYQRPDARSDRLYRPNYVHASDKGGNCLELCGDDASHLVERPTREEGPDDLMVHRGVIASGSALMKDARIRDRLAQEKGVLCFEMEAAGLVNTFPCLVIRGICDYSDSHKNDDWHGYAAMMAAAYAKQVLSVLQPWTVESIDKITSHDLQGIKDDVSEVYKKVEDVNRAQQETREDKEHNEILDWLTTVEFTNRQNQLQRDRHKGTGRWFLHAEEFELWISQQGQTLFCPGMPGAGKTHMASLVIHHLQSFKAVTSPPAIAYIYCDYQEQHSQETLVSSLLRQLSQSRRPFPPELKSLHKLHKVNRTRPSFDELRATLCEVVSMQERCFIIVDALDECEETNGIRKDIIVTLKELRTLARANILATSRDIPRIQEHFVGDLRLRIQASDRDIDRYLDTQIPKILPELDGDQHQSLHMDIKTSVRKAAAGMFLLARLHLGLLEGKLNPREIRDALKCLPSGENALDQAYHETLERIQSQKGNRRELAMRTLAWVAFSMKPLTIEQLQHALAVEIGTDELDFENITEENVVLSTCMGLITTRRIFLHNGKDILYDEEEEETDSDQGDISSTKAVKGFVEPVKKVTVIYLVHETTQNYFNQTHQRWFENVEKTLFQVCLTYLKYESTSSEASRSELEASYPFYSYAASSYYDHFQRNDEDPQIQEQLQEFFLNPLHVYSIIRHLRIGQPRDWNGLHLAVYYGCERLIPPLLEKGLGGYVYHPLQNHGSGFSPLRFAIQRRFLNCVRLLVSAAEIHCDIEDSNGDTALISACGLGFEDAVRLLLTRGKETPQSIASPGISQEADHHRSSAYSVDVNHTNFQGKTPLIVACRQRASVGIVNLLLNNVEIGYNHKDEQGRTALSYALEMGHSDIVERLLSQTEIDCTTPDFDGRAPLHWAAIGGSADCMEHLLRTNWVTANLNGHDCDGKTAFSLALEYRRIEIADILFAISGIEYAKADSYDATPLFYAIANQCTKYTELILSKPDIDVNSILHCPNGETPLCTAARTVSSGVFRQLLSRSDVNVNIPDHKGMTPLAWCIERRHELMCKALLLRQDVDVNTYAGMGRYCLHEAVRWGNEHVTKLLLTKPDVLLNVADRDGMTPLDQAIRRSDEGIVELLVAGYEDGLHLGASFDKPTLFEAMRSENTKLKAILLDHLKTPPNMWASEALISSTTQEFPTTFKLLQDKLKEWMHLHSEWKTECLRQAAYCGGISTLQHVIETLQSTRGTESDELDEFSLGARQWSEVDIVEIASFATCKDISLLDSRGYTALHSAAVSRDVRAIRILLEMGADPAVKNSNGLATTEAILDAYRWCYEYDDSDFYMLSLKLGEKMMDWAQKKNLIPRESYFYGEDGLGW